MPVHPLPPTLPPLHEIWEEAHDKGRQPGGCVQPVAVPAAVKHELWGLERFPLHISLWRRAAVLFHFHAAASFVEAALGLINTQTIWRRRQLGQAPRREAVLLQTNPQHSGRDPKEIKIQMS